MFCTHCGQPLPAPARFCPACGTRVARPGRDDRVAPDQEDPEGFLAQVSATLRTWPWMHLTTILLLIGYGLELFHGSNYLRPGSELTWWAAAMITAVAGWKGWWRSLGALVAWGLCALIYQLGGHLAVGLDGFIGAVADLVLVLLVFHVFAIGLVLMDLRGSERKVAPRSGALLGAGMVLLFMLWPTITVVQERVERMRKVARLEVQAKELFRPFTARPYTVLPVTSTTKAEALIVHEPSVVAQQDGAVNITHEIVFGGRRAKATIGLHERMLVLPDPVVYAVDGERWALRYLGPDSLGMSISNVGSGWTDRIVLDQHRYLAHVRRSEEVRVRVQGSVASVQRIAQVRDSLAQVRDTLEAIYLGAVLDKPGAIRFKVPPADRERILVLDTIDLARFERDLQRAPGGGGRWKLFTHRRPDPAAPAAPDQAQEVLADWMLHPTTPASRSNPVRPIAPKAKNAVNDAPDRLLWVEEVDREAELPGTFADYLIREQQYPQADIDAGQVGTVMVEFTVELDGRVTDAKLYNNGRGSTGTRSMNEEALRLIRGSGPWVPAQKEGLPVRYRMVKKIRFDL